ncbi:MAG TPA: hypothetical protein VJ553_01710, partial [Candidatus Paceibacterota bacterium]|nr:hypothetical protein [Candidatus Paceibacterota bacterium]
MKKILVVVAVLIGLVFTTGAPAFARNVGVVSPKPSPVQKGVKGEAGQNQRTKNQLTEKHRETIRNYWNKMAKRLGMLVKNEKRIAEKMAQRIDKQAAAGKDVTAARVKLEEGKKLIGEAETMLK